MPVNFSTTINSVFLIESLRDDDQQTGRIADRRTGQLLLHSTLAPLCQRHRIRIEPKVREARDATALFRTLEDVERIVAAEHLHPILQVDCHGSAQGIVLADGNLIPWQVLSPYLQRINQASRTTLIVCSSMCWGAHLAQALVSPEAIISRAPFWAVIGPNREVWSSDLLEGWTQFYQILIDRSDAYGATKALRGAKTTASLLIAEHIFARAFQLYVMQALNPDNADQRVADIAAKAQAHGNPHVDTSAVKKMMFDIEHHFYMVRRRYLMIDLFPEIIGRFTLGFADMIAMTNPFA